MKKKEIILLLVAFIGICGCRENLNKIDSAFISEVIPNRMDNFLEVHDNGCIGFNSIQFDPSIINPEFLINDSEEKKN